MPRFSGRLLRSIREAAGLNVWQLADLIDRSPRTVDAYELGRQTPTVGCLEALCATLQCRPDDLFEVEAAAR